MKASRSWGKNERMVSRTANKGMPDSSESNARSERNDQRPIFSGCLMGTSPSPPGKPATPPLSSIGKGSGVADALRTKQGGETRGTPNVADAETSGDVAFYPQRYGPCRDWPSGTCCVVAATQRTTADCQAPTCYPMSRSVNGSQN